MTFRSTEEKLTYFLVSICLFLSLIENVIPKPLPFLRIGLANLPVIISLFLLPKKNIILLVFFKIVAQNIISGTLFSYVFLFSAASSLTSALSMMLMHDIFRQRVSCIGISLAGSLASSFAQLFLAKFILFGENVKYIAPFLLISGFVTGFLLGIFTESFMKKSQWIKILTSKREAP